jgi:hypothetical protein
LPFVFVIIGLPWLAFAGFVQRVHRGRISKKLASGVVKGAFVLAALFGFGAVAAASAGLLDLNTLARFAGALVSEAYRAVPGGGLTIWGGALLLLVGFYLPAQREFLRMEASVATCKKEFS